MQLQLEAVFLYPVVGLGGGSSCLSRAPSHTAGTALLCDPWRRGHHALTWTVVLLPLGQPKAPKFEILKNEQALGTQKDTLRL